MPAAGLGGRALGAGTKGAEQGLVEVIEVVEVVKMVFVGFADKPGVEQGKDHFAEVAGGMDTPAVEDGFGERAEGFQGVAAQAVGQLRAADVADGFFLFLDFGQGFDEAFVEEIVGLGGVAALGGADARDGFFEGGKIHGISR